jgi:hypothetical protein
LEDAKGQAEASHPKLRRTDTDSDRGARFDIAEPMTSRSIVDDLRRLSRKVQTALGDALLPGEQPHVVIEGTGGSAIVGTAERVLVIKSGARSGAPFAAHAKAFEFESVIGIRLDTASGHAVVAVDAPVKIVSCRVYWADDRDNPWKARNAIPVDPPIVNVEAGVNALKGLLEAYRDRHPPAGSRPAPAAHPPKKVMQVLPSQGERAVVAPLPVLGERCPHCRAELRPGWRYCPGCGAPSESATAPHGS